MRTDSAEPVRLKDYRPPDYLIDKVDLDVKLDADGDAGVRAPAHPPQSGRGGPARRSFSTATASSPGGSRSTAAVSIRPRASSTRTSSPSRGRRRRRSRSKSRPNSTRRRTRSLMGLYRSGSAYCTQCEAGGISPHHLFPRPARRAAASIRRASRRQGRSAGAARNGNKIDAGDLEGRRGISRSGDDPLPKPCYLFALVGGDLGSVHDQFITRSGRKVDLGIYVEHGKETAPPMRWMR